MLLQQLMVPLRMAGDHLAEFLHLPQHRLALSACHPFSAARESSECTTGSSVSENPWVPPFAPSIPDSESESLLSSASAPRRAVIPNPPESEYSISRRWCPESTLPHPTAPPDPG